MVEHRKPAPESVDEDNPEWTTQDFARARPASEVPPTLFGAKTADQLLRPKRGRPAASEPKAHINIRLDADVVETFRASGRGWQSRMNAALKDWLKTHTPA
jgi:uncharacterized protein (DUF4415 family)